MSRSLAMRIDCMGSRFSLMLDPSTHGYPHVQKARQLVNDIAVASQPTAQQP